MNAQKIKGRIVEEGSSISKAAKFLGITPYTLSKKLSGRAPMTLDEARGLKEMLNISDGEINIYFF